MGEKYDDAGTLGSYCTSETPFANPEGVRTFPGYGASAEDLERGYCRPALREKPEYDLDNYKQRWTQPIISDLVEGGPGLPEDYEFRTKELSSKGFLTRPRLPIER